MKARIDSDGTLDVLRKGKMTPQICPFKLGDERYCGNWCPLFGEPIPGYNSDTPDLLAICKGVEFDLIEDKR
jgi:hypothetical protein